MGALSATTTMYVLSSNLNMGWSWFLAAFVSICGGAWLMRMGLYWAERPALALSWDGVGLSNRVELIPWSQIDSVRGDGPFCLVMKSGHALRCPWTALAPDERVRLLTTVCASLTEWGGRESLRLPASRWTIQSEQLLLRPWTLSDGPSFHRVYSDESLLKHQDYAALSAGESRRRLFHILRVEDRPEAYGWTRAIVCLKTHTVVGHLDVWITGVSIGVGRVGYGIFSEHQKRGFMSEILTVFAQTVCEEWGVSRLEATVKSDNEASKRVLSRAGFLPSGLVANSNAELWTLLNAGRDEQRRFMSDCCSPGLRESG